MCFRLALGEKQRATPPLTYYVLRGAGHRIMFLKETHSLVVSALQPHCVFFAYDSWACARGAKSCVEGPGLYPFYLLPKEVN